MWLILNGLSYGDGFGAGEKGELKMKDDPTILMKTKGK